MIELFEAKHLKFKKIFGLSLIALFLILIFLTFFGLFLAPKIKASSPSPNLRDVGLKDKIEIKFNKPVNRNNISLLIIPEVLGDWRFEDEILSSHLYTKVVFYPEQFLAEKQTYSVKIGGISSLLNPNKQSDIAFSFTTQSIPQISGASIQNEARDISINKPIEIFMDQKNDDVVDFDFIFDPPVQFEKTFSTDRKKYTLQPKTNLAQSTTYSLSAKRNILISGQPQSLDQKESYKITFTTEKPPGIENYSPNGTNINVETKEITILFDKEMEKFDPGKEISINPIITGTWYALTNKEVKFVLNQRLSFGTTYFIRIKKGLKSLSGAEITEDLNLPFSTIGRLKVSSFFPKNGSTGTPSSSLLKISFDQAADHQSAQAQFFIEPKVEGEFSWQDNTLIFKPDNLAKDSSYKFGVRSNIKSISGLDSDQDFEASFRTEESSSLLPVSMDYQDKALSCEAASLKMALRYKGINISENDIMDIIGYDPTIRSGNIWGDPFTAFVGNINGRQNTTGYGVYWDPVAKAANHWRSAKAFSGWSLENAAREIAAGNPIVIWGTTGGSIKRDDWQTPGGKEVLAWHGEHARVLIGFRGNALNPTEFILNDPIAGKITWSREKFLSDWSTFNNSGVVVY